VSKHSSSNSSSNDAFVLSFKDVASVLRDVPLGDFFLDLATEIEAVYRDSSIRPVKRMGWSTPPNALEIMGCQGEDFTCVKLISSVPSSNGSPTVTGTLLCTEVGSDRARLVCDAAFLTPLRTAASSGVVMRKVVPSAKTLGIVGTGLEGIAHAVALACMNAELEAIYLYDLDRDQAVRAAKEVQYLLGRHGLLRDRELRISPCERQEDLNKCDALITATFAERDVDVLSDASGISDGTFIAAVGADLENKRELPMALYKRAKFIADDLEQCLQDGELQYAKGLWADGEEPRIDGHRGRLAEGRVMSAADFLIDPQPLLSRSEPITIYDSAGFSGQDLAVARLMLKVLEECGWERQLWNPGYSRSLVELLGCSPAPQAAS
jgi:ornithine cyclodeaminase/alanine dehydrogenase-like protein (mu-crystallin family)